MTEKMGVILIETTPQLSLSGKTDSFSGKGFKNETHLKWYFDQISRYACEARLAYEAIEYPPL